MPENIPQLTGPSQLAADSRVFTSYLQQLGLPIDNIIASTEERTAVLNNLPTILNALSVDDRREARYLSKFLGASAIGLFDAALNYIWNEVVINLRRKASLYGIELFFDAAVGGKNREAFVDERDLPGLKDTVLLAACRKLELISDIVFRKLDHILTMRNEVAASHPNVESIGGFELLGWLQTCINDVIQERPSDSAIKIKSLIDNLRSLSAVLDETMVTRFVEELQFLSTPHANNLLVTCFGIFASPQSDQILRANVARLAPHIWEHAEEAAKYRIGVTIDGYRTNLRQQRLNNGVEFLKLVGGLRFETIAARSIALTELIDKLESVHLAWDNFYNEPQVARDIRRYIVHSTDIPEEVLPRLTRILVRCRIGNGVSFCQGVSPSAKPIYDELLALLNDEGISLAIMALFHPDVNVKLSWKTCRVHLKSILETLKSITISERLKQVIDFLLSDIENAQNAHRQGEFRDLASPFMTWS